MIAFNFNLCIAFQLKNPNKLEYSSDIWNLLDLAIWLKSANQHKFIVFVVFYLCFTNSSSKLMLDSRPASCISIESIAVVHFLIAKKCARGNSTEFMCFILMIHIQVSIAFETVSKRMRYIPFARHSKRNTQTHIRCTTT